MTLEGTGGGPPLRGGRSRRGVRRSIVQRPPCRSAAARTASSHIAVANRPSNTVSILLGDGKGAFSAPTHHLARLAPYWVTVGDLNGDGLPDLAVADSISHRVSVLLRPP